MPKFLTIWLKFSNFNRDRIAIAACGFRTSVMYGNDMYDFRPHLINAIKSLTNATWFRNQKFSINGEFQPIFTTIPTRKGLAYTFNLLDADELFNFDR
jgi:hypothetical protein